MYVFNTWLLANLIHPVILTLYFKGGNDSVLNFGALTAYFSFLFYTLIFSIPALIAAALLFMLIKKMQTDAVTAFFTWLFLVTSIPFVIVAILFLMFFNEWWVFGEIGIVIPACIAVFVVTSLRLKQFIKAFEKSKQVIETSSEQSIS